LSQNHSAITPGRVRGAWSQRRDRLRRRLDIPTLRAAYWTFRALRKTKRALKRDGYQSVELTDPPQLPPHARRGVDAILRREPNTCLERSIVLQRWLAAHGTPLAIVIGVTSPTDFRAHAWLEGEQTPDDFVELTRLPAR
jgi:hypothetical protein